MPIRAPADAWASCSPTCCPSPTSRSGRATPPRWPGHRPRPLAGWLPNSGAGDRLGGLQPPLLPSATLEVRPGDTASLAGYDVVVLALPHGESAAIAAQLPADTLVIDCGADHRLNDPAAWARWYGGGHAGAWPYGLPELPGQREKLQRAKIGRAHV